MKKLNDYQKLFAIKRAIKDSKDLSYNGAKIVDIWLDSIHVLAGVSYLEVRLADIEGKICADIQRIKIIE